MEQRSYQYSQKRNNSYYTGNISRNQVKSNNTVINLVNIIYDNEFVSLINDLSSSLKNCFKLINDSLKNIKDISSSLGNQIIYSKCIINDYIMINKKNKNDKLIQVKDRLDFIDNNKNLLESNISFMNVNITGFLEHAKNLFKRMKISRNNKLNNIQNNNNILNKDFKFNNYFSNNNYNSSDNFHSKETKNKRNYSSYDNMRYKAKSQNTFQNYNSLSFKKNKSLKNISDNLLINSSDDVNYHNIENKNDCSERQKTISFNLRRFMFNKNKNKINNLLENISLNKEKKMNNNNNLLFNYCSLINNSKAKNNRKKINKGNIKSLKNINSFKNDNRINNIFNNNIYENRNDNNLNNNKKKINFNYFSNSSINKIINNDIDNSDSLKMIENNNNKQKNLDSILANKIIEYFTLLKSNEKNKMKIEKIQKYLINISLNIINKKENHINSLKHNYLKNSKIPENIMRNNYSHQMRINNSVGNDKRENNNENIINILNKELNKKNEYIRKMKNIMENKCNKNGIVKAQNFEIIQKRKILLIIKKEINLNYLSDINNYKKIEELKSQILELKHNYNNENNNNKNYKYKYELMIEEINTKKNEINELNNKIDELTKTNNSLLNKLDTIELSNKNLEQEKTNLTLKIKKLEDFSSNKKIIITNSDEEPIEDFSDIIEEQSSENEKEKNLVKENNKLQEKINILQSELNKKILNENDKNRKLSRNAGNNEYENCVDFDPINRIKKEKNSSNNNMSELKIKEDLIEKLQSRINELEKNKNIFFSKKDEYIIISEKNYKTLKWFLLTKKININNLNYENTFWANKDNVDKELIKNINLEISDEEKMIMNYLKKLEEKENIISKLQLKIKNMEKNMNLNINNKNMRSKSSNTKNILKNNNEEEDEDYVDSEFD